MTYYIFQEPVEGSVAHTPVSRALRENPLLLQWIGQSCEDMWPAATRIVEAMARWPGSQEPNQSGFNIANDTTDSIFVEVSKEKPRVQRLSHAMSFLQSFSGLSTKHVVDGFDWDSLRWSNEAAATVVDIGGGHGHINIEIVKRHPFIRCIVRDLPDVLQHPNIPQNLQERITLMPHDFFEEQPIKRAVVYFLRWILHDWPDAYAVRILKAPIPALRRGSKVVLNELCMPGFQTVSLCQERYLR